MKPSGIHRHSLEDGLSLFRTRVSTPGSLEVDGVFISSCEIAEKYCSARYLTLPVFILFYFIYLFYFYFWLLPGIEGFPGGSRLPTQKMRVPSLGGEDPL